MQSGQFWIITAAATLLISATAARADTTSVKAWQVVRVAKNGAHCVDDPNCFNRFTRRSSRWPRQARPTDRLRDARCTRLGPQRQLDAEGSAAVDLNLVHPLTGPVYIEGAKRGDVLAVTLIDVEPDEYGYTTVVPGFGFLRDRFTEPYIANWKLNRLEAVSDQIPGVRIPFNGFMGTVGVLPGLPEVDAWVARETQLGKRRRRRAAAAADSARCRPTFAARTAATRTSACAPSRRARTAATWTSSRWWSARRCCCPASSDGCGLFVGDVHFAQGDGEVAGTAIEMGATVTVRTEIRKGMASR